MTAALIVLVTIAAVASRPLELRLWRSGRISDRAVAALVLARFPIVCALFGLILGMSPLLLIGTTAIAMIPGLVAYRLTLEQVRVEAAASNDQAEVRRSIAPRVGGRPELRLSIAADFSRESDAGLLLGMGVSLNGSIVGVMADSPYSRRRRVRIAAEAVIVGASMRRVSLATAEFRSGVTAQLTQDQGLVLIGFRRVSDEPNTVVLDGDGHHLASFSVGDGVDSALLDEDDRLWVSYFDEGTTGGDSLSRTGLNRFALNGRATWSFEPKDGLEPIFDCYALNVTGLSAWAYVYPSFDVLNVRGDQIRRWTTRVAGAHGLLILDDDALVLVGSYEDRQEAFKWHLGDHALADPTRVAVTSTGGPLPQAPAWVGRGDVLWAIESGVCWRAELVG